MTLDKTASRVGFIGLGIMGGAMARNILAAGWTVNVGTRTPSKAEPLIAAGAIWHETPGEVAAASDVTFTMVGYPSDVEEIYLGAHGLIERSAAGSVLVDMTTSSPSLAERIADAAAAAGVFALDAPVSGGDVGARQATLSIMVGGADAAFDSVRPLLALMGTRIVLQGGPGAGQHTKMANQIAIAGTMMGVCESLAYARRAGLDPHRVLESIGQGAAASFLLSNLGPKALAGDFAPGFFVRHFVKDIGIALAEADRMKLALPGLAEARRLYQRLVDEGHGEDGTQALLRLYG